MYETPLVAGIKLINNGKSLTTFVPPSSLTTVLTSVNLGAISLFVMVHVSVSLLETTTSVQLSYVVLYPVTDGSVIVYVPGETERSFCPSISKGIAESLFTWKLKSEYVLFPPLSFVTIFLTIKVPPLLVFVILQTTSVSSSMVTETDESVSNAMTEPVPFKSLHSIEVV